MLTVDTLSCMPRKPLTESEKKVGLAARIHPSLLKQLGELARADERTLSFMVDRAIRFYLAHVAEHGKDEKRRR